MRQLARTWWEISTTHDSVVRVDEATKCAIIEAMKLRKMGVLPADAELIEGKDPHGIDVGLDVSMVDAWWISTPESREIVRTHRALLDDEQDAFDREHNRGEYKPKQWTPDDD